MTYTTLPTRGVVFWPVESGDCTTIVIDQERKLVMQVDLRDMAKADNSGEHVSPVVDHLVAQLPKRGDRPYLAAFALTHADMDHCTGFAELLERVDIGELWATPRLWREYEDGDTALCDDARAFQKEAERRVEVTRKAVARGEKPVSGDRILVVGYDTDHDKHAYSDLPDEYLTGPGHLVTAIDGENTEGEFEAFLHAPFKDDCAAARNDTSLGMQVTLFDPDGTAGRVLLLGDLAYATLIKIFDYSEEHERGERVDWHIMLAPHHCSKYAMHVGEEFQQDIMDTFERHALDGAVIVVSGRAVPSKDEATANPPHRLAKDCYLEIVPEEQFLCTAEWPDAEDPRPIAFGLGPAGFVLLDPVEQEEAEASESRGMALAKATAGILAGLAAAKVTRAAVTRRLNKPAAPALVRTGLDRVQDAVAANRDGNTPPNQRIGFGQR